MKNYVVKRLCLLTIALAGLGWGVGHGWATRTDRIMRQHLLRQAVSIAETVRPEMVEQLSFTETDVNTPTYEYIRRQMAAFGKYLPQRGIYSMAQRDGKLVFGPESYTPDDPMASAPGTVYQEPSPQDIAIFTTGKPVTIGPQTDEYGTFVSAVAPVVDPSTGEVLMAVGIDVTTDNWHTAVNQARYKAMSVVLLAGLLISAGVAAIRWRRHRAAAEPLPPTQMSAKPIHLGRTPLGARRYASTGLLLGMAALAVAFLVVVLAQSRHWTLTQITQCTDRQARLAVEFDAALRDYVAEHIRPEMEKHLGPDEFMPETMSTSFIARSVFEKVHKAFPDSVLRFASTNPRNPANRATPAEESLIEYFEQHPDVNNFSGTMPFFEEGQEYSVYAVARRFEPACLSCHGRPEDAPAALRERYGVTAGFGRSVGEVSLDLVAIPISAPYLTARAQVWRHTLAAFGLCLLFLIGIAILIRADLRQRRRIERSLRASEQRLASIVQGSPIPTFIIDANHRVIHWNGALEQLSGIAAKDILGTRDQWRAFYTSERPCLADLLVDGAAGMIPQWYEAETHKSKLIDEAYEGMGFFPDIGDSGRWARFMAAVIRDDQGDLVGAMETVQDITEQKHAEQESQEREAFIKAILDNIPIGVAVHSIDPSVQFQYMNDNFPRLYRTTREALTGPEAFWEAVYEDPTFREELKRKVVEDCTSGDPERMHWDDVPIVREGRETCFISAKNALIPNSPLMISIVWDVTERKRVEDKLKESISMLEATLEATADGILVADGHGVIKNFNEQFKTIWHLPDEVVATMDDNQALAVASQQLHDPKRFEKHVKDLWRRRDQEDSDTLHFKDGRVIQYSSKPQYQGDQITGRVWSFRDITEAYYAQQRQEALLQQVASINEELSHFAYAVSHDLKAPLRGIKMLTEWLRADYGEQFGDEGKGNLDLLQNRVERMHNLIEGVLQYSRVGRSEEDIQDVNLDALLPQIIDTIAPPEHIAIRVEGPLPVLRCVEARITQVFQNLLTNAIKYMDKPAGQIIVGCSKSDEAWTFSVSDNGPGIEEEHFERIFNIFQTLTRRDEYESTGLGLTLVKKIVEHHGGRVWVTSEVGRGSTFFFTFPIKNERIRNEELQTRTVG